MDPVEAFLLTLCRYLRDRGEMVLGMARAAGQEKLLVSLYGLWRRHEAEETGFLKFMDIVSEILNCEDCLERLKEIGIEEFRELDGEPYMVIDIDKVSRLDCKHILGEEEG
ncbi:hypothetical protein Hbut_0478 [Hyperthermus butylicus DSM 5456]|uniref:Uncharacterized protein n=2 Tax=Hyperthermus butylicus TaxID=54248 RepID=A2BK29_HYPBU|nr:hypothetical protein Hbut_0478 [Hyperthermus butylicus DSM 5456]